MTLLTTDIFADTIPAGVTDTERSDTVPDDNERKDPFEGRTMHRLPGMHLITACNGGMPLREALAAFYFMMLHDRVPHNCLITENIQHIDRCTPAGPTMLPVLGAMVSTGLALKEWAYLDPDDAFVFLTMATASIEHVQRWIAEGSHEPYSLPHLGGSIVVRPDWAVEYFGNPDDEQRHDDRQYVLGLMQRVKEGQRT